MKIFSILVASLLSVTGFAGSASGQAAGKILITDVTIISPENLDHVEKGNVLIENDRIVSV
jgi:hypothetical protein